MGDRVAKERRAAPQAHARAPQAPEAQPRNSAEDAAAEAAAKDKRSTLAIRQQATEKTLARFRDKPFSWAGSNCVRLARTHAVNMGHKLPPIPRFASALGAKRALAARGADSVPALLDQYFARLPGPAYAWLGDLIAVPGDPALGLDAIGIADGQGNVWIWSEQSDAAGLSALLAIEADAIAAWRL